MFPQLTSLRRDPGKQTPAVCPSQAPNARIRAFSCVIANAVRPSMVFRTCVWCRHALNPQRVSFLQSTAMSCPQRRLQLSKPLRQRNCRTPDTCATFPRKACIVAPAQEPKPSFTLGALAQSRMSSQMFVLQRLGISTSLLATFSSAVNVLR